MKTNTIAIVTLLFSCGLLCNGAAVPITSLGAQSDIVVIGVVTSVSDESGGGSQLTAQLQVTQVLKGQPGSLNLVIAGPPLPTSTRNAFGLSSIGDSGLWFLKESLTGGYQVIPRDNRVYSNPNLYYSIDVSMVAPASQNDPDQQLLYRLIKWYQSLPAPSQIDDDAVLVSTDSQRDDVHVPATILLTTLQPLIGSASLSQHIVGLAGAVRLGSEAAVAEIVSELSTLKTNSRFALIEEAIKAYPQSASSLQSLQQMIGLGVPGLDAAAGAAIEKIGGKAILPAMVNLLDSTDPQAQLRATEFLGRYSIFADANGNISSSGGPSGPWFDKVNLLYSRPSDGGPALSQCVSFWKSWWNSHSTSLGFE